MRALILAAFAFGLPSLAFADETVAGHWKADLGSNVTVDMTVSADGHWSSKTMEGDEEIANLTGTYTQTSQTPASGRLVFRPTQGATGEQSGPQIETDDYELSDNVLKLSSNGDTVVFQKQTD